MARILFVDDDPFTLEMLDKSVQIFGHEALLANCGEQALRLAEAQPPDLIMTDMRLPDMDGLVLLNQLKQGQATAHIAVVMLSASPELDAAELTRAAGAKDYLLKPVRLQTLQEVIERYT
jgi:CheY-like chemotaxis protein